VLQNGSLQGNLFTLPLRSTATALHLELVTIDWTDPKFGERKELLWARPLGDGFYRLRTVPGFAEGVSRNDVLRCFENDDGLHVQEVVERGGHRTVRVDIDPGSNLETLLPDLPAELSLLQSSNRGLSVDVHPEDDYKALAARLNTLQAQGTLTWYDASAPLP
jgi:hypothetical protein